MLHLHPDGETAWRTLLTLHYLYQALIPIEGRQNTTTSRLARLATMVSARLRMCGINLVRNAWLYMYAAFRPASWNATVGARTTTTRLLALSYSSWIHWQKSLLSTVVA